MTVTNLGNVATQPISALKPADDNPRIITKAAIDIVAKSLSRFGWQQPIVVDESNVILAGHTRYLAAKQLGLDEVPVVVAAGLTPEEAKAYRIADNRTGDFTSWDFPELVDQLEELSGSFSTELALADWKGIVGEFEAMQEAQPLAEVTPPEFESTYSQDTTPQEPESNGQTFGYEESGSGGQQWPEPDNRVSAPPQAPQPQPAPLIVSETVQAQTSESFNLTVVCSSKEASADVQEALIGMRGVVDVRYQR